MPPPLDCRCRQVLLLLFLAVGCACASRSAHARRHKHHRSHRAAFAELLAAPAGDDAGAPTGTTVRASAAYTCNDERFLLKNKDYDRQYAQLYYYRLLQMREHVEAAAQRVWPDVPGACCVSVER